MRSGNAYRALRRNRAGRFSEIIRLLLALCMALAAAGAGAVDVSQDFDNLQDREYFLRIGIIESTRRARIVPQGVFYLHDRHGAVLHEGIGNTVLTATATGTSPARPVFHVMLQSFRSDQIDRAERFASQASRQINQRVAVHTDPRHQIAPSPADGLPPRPPNVLAAMGPFDSRDKAAAARQAAAKAYPEARIIQTFRTDGKGMIEIRDPNGRVLAAAQGYIGIWPENRDTLIHAIGEETRQRGGWNAGGRGDPNPAYRGLMELRVNPEGEISVINRVFIEHYLYGVLPGEIGASAPPETMKAQAVISRSTSIAKLRQSDKHAGWYFDFCDEECCQVYKGAHFEAPATTRAADQTLGQVCTYHNEIIDAVFSQSCGGITANNEDVWNSNPSPYLRSRPDSTRSIASPDLSSTANLERHLNTRFDDFCHPSQPGFPSFAAGTYRWQRTFEPAALLRSLVAGGHVRGTALHDVRVHQRTPSGRINQIEVVTDAGSFTIRHSLTIRRAFNGLPSSAFILKPSYNNQSRLTRLTIEGMGSGHGVGLCQLGAMGMARQGHDYLSILKHYYRGIDVYRIYR